MEATYFPESRVRFSRGDDEGQKEVERLKAWADVTTGSSQTEAMMPVSVDSQLLDILAGYGAAKGSRPNGGT